jgi:hypothetical protein
MCRTNFLCDWSINSSTDKWNIVITCCWLLSEILIFNKITDLKTVPLIHISIKNDCCYDKNVIVPIAEFWLNILILTVITDFLFKIVMLTVIANHWTTMIFLVVIGALCQISFTIRLTHV